MILKFRYWMYKRIQEGLHRRLAIAVLPGVRACPIVLIEPYAQIRLQLLQVVIKLLTKGSGGCFPHRATRIVFTRRGAGSRRRRRM